MSQSSLSKLQVTAFEGDSPTYQRTADPGERPQQVSARWEPDITDCYSTEEQIAAVPGAFAVPGIDVDDSVDSAVSTPPELSAVLDEEEIFQQMRGAARDDEARFQQLIEEHVQRRLRESIPVAAELVASEELGEEIEQKPPSRGLKKFFQRKGREDKNKKKGKKR
mmetsp:Transcript_22027/g.30660  ORF Transcript_22027/g.30660 Transcript_22027/m.30660 type:complete len:166 (+) Transcript_22027:27-524(+)